MKIFLSSLLSLLILTNLAAQTENKGVYLGMNAARLIQMIGDNEKSDGINPYLIDMGYSSGKLGFRFGIGLDNSTSVNQPSAGNGETLRQRDSSKADWRFGAHYRLATYEKWQINFGVDYYQSKSSRLLLTEFTNENGEAVVDENSHDYKESGISPCLTIQYRPHPRVSVGTELLLRFGKHQLTEESKNSLFPASNVEIITDGNRNYFMAPSALFICLTL